MQKKSKLLVGNDNKRVITYMDVKALYDAAYVEKQKGSINLDSFQRLLDFAEKMDAAYRVQLDLLQATRYKSAA